INESNLTDMLSSLGRGVRGARSPEDNHAPLFPALTRPTLSEVDSACSESGANQFRRSTGEELCRVEVCALRPLLPRPASTGEERPAARRASPAANRCRTATACAGVARSGSTDTGIAAHHRLCRRPILHPGTDRADTGAGSVATPLAGQRQSP